MTAEELMAAAHAAHDRQDWRGAEAAYRAALAAGGDDRMWISLGDVLVEADRPADAADAYLRRAQAAPDDPVAAARFASAADANGWTGAARLARRRAYALGHTHPGETWREPPLRQAWSPPTLQALAQLGWGVEAVEALSTPAPDLPWGSPDTPPQANPLQVALPPLAGAPRLAVVATADASALRTRARALARAATALAPGSALVIVGVTGGDSSTARRDAAVLASELRGLPAAALVLDGEGAATARALVDLALGIAAGLGADALVMSGESAPPPGALDRLATAFADDPMAGAAVLVPGASAPPTYEAPRLGAAVWVRGRLLAELGGLDALYEDADGGLLDLCWRANRTGFSTLVVRDPHATADAAPSLDELDRRILAARYPEASAQESRPSRKRAEAAARLAAAAVASPPTLLLDLTDLSEHHDGTSELSAALAHALREDARVETHLWGAPEALERHGLGRWQAERRAAPPGPLSRAYSACLKPAQPLDGERLARTWSAAPVAGFLMLDPIAMDVERLNVADLRGLWSLALDHSELCGFLSRYTADQFDRRFDATPHPGRFVLLCSTAPDEYPGGGRAPQGRGEGLLVVGNPFGHKNLDGAVRRLRAQAPQLPLTVLGEVRSPRPGLRWLRSGGLSPEALDGLYADAAAVVFPSFYEGFGLPVMHALAHGRPVLAVDQPVFHEIRARCGLAANLHLYPTTKALAADAAAVAGGGFHPQNPLVREHRWRDAARNVVDAVLRALDDFDPRALERRLRASPSA